MFIIWRGTPFPSAIHDAKACQLELIKIREVLHQYNQSGAYGDSGYDAKLIRDRYCFSFM